MKVHDIFNSCSMVSDSPDRSTSQQAARDNYTVGHKKRATLFGIITPMFRGEFLHFLHQWK